MNDMNSYSKSGILLSMLLISSFFTFFLISEVNAEEEIFASAINFENTIIIEFENGEGNTSEIKTIKIWLEKENSFKSFKTEPGWAGTKFSEGQLLVFTALNTLSPNESVKFGVVTEKKTTAINWKVLDENENAVDAKKIQIQEVTSNPIIVEENIDDTTQSGEELYGIKKFIPEKLRIDANVRLVGNGFSSEQNMKIYLNDDLLKSIKTNENGNFITTIHIPTTVKTGTNDFVIVDESGNAQSTNINISESKNRFLKTGKSFKINDITNEVKFDEMLTISGEAQPNSAIILVIKDEDGITQKIRVVEVDVNGDWNFNEIISRDESLGTKSILLKNDKNFISRDVLIKSDKTLNVSSSATRYSQGDTIQFSGEGFPNQDITAIIKNPENNIVYFKTLDGTSSGKIDFEFVTNEVTSKGTYSLIVSQENESDVYLFGIGKYPTSRIVVLMDQTSYVSSNTAFLNIVGPGSTTLLLVVVDPSDNTKFSENIKTNSNGKLKHVLDISDYSSGVYQVIVTSGNVQDSTKFSIGLPTASGPITINTSKSIFIPGDRIIIIGQTGKEALLTITLFDPTGNIVGKSEVFSTSDGNFSTEELGIPSNGEYGTWKLTANSRLDSANLELVVSESGEQVLQLLIDKTDFYPGESMIIQGVGSSASGHVSVDITDSQGENVAELGTPMAGSGEFSLPWIIPHSLNFGSYTITAYDGVNTVTFQFFITD